MKNRVVKKMKPQKKLAYETKTANKTKTSTKQECSKKLLGGKSGYVQHTSLSRLYSDHSQCIAVYEEGRVQSSNIEVCQ
jgi:hypothetical protein